MAAPAQRDLGAARSVERAVLDYFEGWFEADEERMRRALHPELVKRRAGDALGVTTAARMIELTGLGEGRADAGPVEIVLADVQDDVASVVVRGGPYLEYLHLVHTSEGWKIANALWRPA